MKIKQNGSAVLYCSANPCVIATPALANASANSFTAEVTDTNGYTGVSSPLIIEARVQVQSSLPTSNALTIEPSKPTIQAGDVLGMTATLDPSISVQGINLYFDDILVTNCHARSCYGEYPVPISGTKSSYTIKAVAATVQQGELTATKTLNVVSTASNLVTTHVGQATILPNQAASVVITVEPSVNVVRTDITVDGTIIRSCASAIHQCQWSDYLSGGIGSTHQVYGVVSDNIGRTFTSDVKTIIIGANDTPSITVAAAKPTIYVGETIDITVFASDNDGIASIEIMKDGSVIKTCQGAAPCTATTGPWSTIGTITFSGRATDTKSITGTGDHVSVSVANP